MPKIAIIAALKREITPLLHDSAFSWKAAAGADVGFGSWQTDRAVIVCAGIGKAATDATERAIRQFEPSLVISAGLAGALIPGMKVGSVVRPAVILNSSTGDRYEVLGGHGVLVTASGVAGEHGKRLLARHFAAETADMEAAFVAGVARQHGTLFAAVKSVSDEFDFNMPDLNAFITEDGRFETRRFGMFVATHPRLWPVVRQLSRNSREASLELCRELRNLILQDTATSQKQQVASPRESQPAR